MGGWTHLPPIPCPATASPCLELVRSSTLNSEHFPQPTQQIKDIVRQHQQLPRGGRPEALRSAHPLSPLALFRDCLPMCLSAGLTAPCPTAFRECLFTQVVQMRLPPRAQGGQDRSLGIVCDPMPVSGPLGVIMYGDGGRGSSWVGLCGCEEKAQCPAPQEGRREGVRKAA